MHRLEFAMAFGSLEARKVLTEARKLIGTSYADMDCSHFVCHAYTAAGFAYPYAATATFARAAAGPAGPFEQAAGSPQAADVLLFSGHMGLWDPEGCTVLGSNAECKRLKNDAPVLSSRSGGLRGPDFGIPKWWGSYQVYRWVGLKATGIKDLKKGDIVRLTRMINPTMVSHWKYGKECAQIGAGLAEGTRLTVEEVHATPGDMWVRVQIPGRQPPGYLKVAGEEYAHSFQAGVG
jgi:hypothetical protein